ncbi:Protein CBG10560 [Caenorhabditis briggsae]|uniref:Protein CBG10560 n=1 Tax=Caenorhabditis briggsae TaxID=6238 RepID=A8XBC9_CAEBR|nr:Protein CBG10560 [Caenorhabditis briggsae]CAP29944.2 Protein CBG10560 [Caenorhabditis briggsae]
MKIRQFLMFSMFLVLSSSYILERLSEALPDYKVSRNSKIYFISAEPQKNLDMAQLHLMNGMETRNGTVLTTPTATGFLIPSKDDDTLLVIVPANFTGFLYITEIENINVYGLPQDLTVINFQPGTNLFFNLDFQAQTFIQKIPVAKNVIISETVSFIGVTGVPEGNGTLFFNSSSIPGLTTYNQLELEMEIFNFQSNGIDVKYEISYGLRQGIDINYSGLWMTRSYPIWPDYQAKEYGILNHQNDPITLSMMCRFPIHTNFYTVNVTLINADKSIQPPIILNSTLDIFVKSVSAFSGIKIEGGGPYSIQYELWDPLATTVGYETSTKAGGSLNFWMGLVLAGILNLL